MQMSEQNSRTFITHSACVAKARCRLCLKEETIQDIPLGAITFATHTGSGNEGWWGLKDRVSGNVAGEICYCRIKSRTDPVQAYLCVRLSSGTCFESVEFVSAPQITHFFVRGTVLGHMVEEQLPKDKSWWRRIVEGKRMWRVFLHDTMTGSIELNYPLSRKSQLLLQLGNGTSLPISLASFGGSKSTRFVIPSDTPEVSNDLQELHFLLVIVFRSLLQLDFCTGS